MPIYVTCTGEPWENNGRGVRYSRWPEKWFWPGRIIKLDSPLEEDQALFFTKAGGSLEAIQEWLGENDIVHVPLFFGNIQTPPTFPPRRLPRYADHLSALELIAREAQGVLLGNLAGELSWWDSCEGDKQLNLERMQAFIDETAPLVVRAGGKPFFGTIDKDVVWDCYEGGWRLHNAVNSYGGGHIVFCGFTLVPNAYYDLSHPDFRGERWQMDLMREYEAEPFPTMQEYLRSGFFISSVRGVEGLKHRNDLALKEFGFSAGLTSHSKWDAWNRWKAEQRAIE